MVEMFNYRSLLISTIVTFFSIMSFNGLAQCNVRFSYSVEQAKSISDDTQKADFSLFMKLEEGGGNSVIELFDLYKGQVIEKKDLSFNTHELKKVFNNVKPSRYLIYIQQAGCKMKSITTGIEGIEIK